MSWSFEIGLSSHLFCVRAERNKLSSAALSSGLPMASLLAADDRDGEKRQASGRNVPKYGISVGGGTYSALFALRSASTPSSNVSSTLVFAAFTAPPAETAIDSAAALTLSGILQMISRSCSP